MRNIITLALLFAIYAVGFSQASSERLQFSEIDVLFNDKMKEKLGIEYEIHRVDRFYDKEGEHYLVITENMFDCESCYDKIKAYCFLKEDNVYELEWKMQDFILADGNEVSEEFSISFWHDYITLEDLDNDGYVEPILVYGTLGINETDDGRIKILIYHKGKKRAIRHQNSTLDGERHTQVDTKFYDLPGKVQRKVIRIMQTIEEDGYAIFPFGWEDGMDNEELKLEE